MLFSTGTAKNVISSTEKKLFRKKRKRTREWREVEEAFKLRHRSGGMLFGTSTAASRLDINADVVVDVSGLDFP
jgi:hypothetical protein